jgi:hypothetical protein
MARKHKSLTKRGGYIAPGTKAVSTTVAGPQTVTTTHTEPTYRESFVTYESQTSNVPSVPEIIKPNQSPMPKEKAEIVFLIGLALIIASGITNKQLLPVADLFFNARNMKYTRQQARVGMVVIGGELLFLIILTAFSESSDDFANIALALLFGLGLVWSVQNVKSTAKWRNFLAGKSKQI